MKKPYNLYSLYALRNNNWPITPKGIARPVRYFSWLNDFKLAWLVFTRKADAFIWSEEDIK